jgi:ABC-type glycerol-3-phosphate transport system substrate-binding protein
MASEGQNGEEQLKTVRNFRVGEERVVKKKRNWLFLVIAGGLVMIFLGTWFFYQWQQQVLESQIPVPDPVSEKVVLTYWGLWEPTETLREQIAKFESENPSVSVDYKVKNIETYRRELDQALATGQNAPDIFRYHVSWRSSLDTRLDALPAGIMTQGEFASEFYPVFTTQLKDGDGRIKGIPLMYDGLALLYNRDIFTKNKIEIPKSWPEFREVAVRLTQRDETGRIGLAGAAMGLGSNVDFASDIVGLLLAQRQVNFVNLDPEVLLDALEYYVNYYLHPDLMVWDETFSNSTQAFASGGVAMIFAPSWLIHDVLKINPGMGVGVTNVPQLDAKNPVDWATYWVEGVNVNSVKKPAAWSFLKFLSQPGVLEVLNREQEMQRSFGEIYPLVKMADLLAHNSYVQPYLLYASKSVGFPMNDKTFDRGISDSNRDLVLEMIDGLASERYKNRQAKLDELSRNFLALWQDNLVRYKYIEDPLGRK